MGGACQFALFCNAFQAFWSGNQGCKFAMFYKRIQRNPLIWCPPLNSLNSISFISELEAFLFGGPASLETKFDMFYKRIGWFRVRINSLNCIGFISEFNEILGGDWMHRPCKFAMFYKRIWRNVTKSCRAGRLSEFVKFAMFYKRISLIGKRVTTHREP